MHQAAVHPEVSAGYCDSYPLQIALTNTLTLSVIDYVFVLKVMMLLNNLRSDLNRFTMSRWSISKSTVYVSFPLTNLDLGPYGPVDCGNLASHLCLQYFLYERDLDVYIIYYRVGLRYNRVGSPSLLEPLMIWFQSKIEKKLLITSEKYLHIMFLLFI